MYDPLKQEEPLPDDIEATMELLREGILAESLAVLRQHMDDTGQQVIYELAVARMVSPENVVFLPVAMLLPQRPDDTATKSAPEAVH